MPNTGEAVTLHDCLDAYFEDELLEGFKCDGCKLKNVKKTSYGEELPKYLVVQAQRTGYDKMQRKDHKDHTNLIIDVSETIDMSKWWPKSGQNSDYEVCAIVEHWGSK